MKENKYTPLADDMYELFLACYSSGFNNEQAFELTKTYCSVAFVNQAIDIKERERDLVRKTISRNRMMERCRTENKTDAE